MTFPETLTRLREAHGLTKKQLAKLIGFDPSYVSHMESGRHRPTYEFAVRADTVLHAEGTLVSAFLSTADHPADAVPAAQRALPGISPGLVVRYERAELSRGDSGFYLIAIQREIHNGSQQPVTRFPVHVEVDVYPGDPRRSRLFYQDNPVTLDELDFRATFDGEPTRWDLVRDRDAVKKLHVRFEPHGMLTPLYPGDSAVIETRYRVPCTKWGDWFEREIRWPTERLSVSIGFPERLGVRLTAREVTWGGDRALPTRIESRVCDGMRYYDWSTARPALTNQYRFDWQLGSRRSPAMP